MAAAATLTIPTHVNTVGQRLDAMEILETTAGSSDASLSADGSQASIKVEVPGNIDKLVARLRAKGVASGDAIHISIPVVPVAASVPVQSDELLAFLNDSPAISDAAYDGKFVTATIAGATAPMRFIYEEMLVFGLMPTDMPTAAGIQDFVL